MIIIATLLNGCLFSPELPKIQSFYTPLPIIEHDAPSGATATPKPERRINIKIIASNAERKADRETAIKRELKDFLDNAKGKEIYMIRTVYDNEIYGLIAVEIYYFEN